MKRVQTTGLVVAILIAAGAAGFGVYQWMQPMRPRQLLPATQPAVPALSAADALHLNLEDLNGNDHSLAEWHGKVLLVNFWATWCPPCRAEMPLLVKLQAKYAARGLQVVGIATDEPSEEKVREFLRQMVVNYPILMSGNHAGDITSALGGNLIGLPYSLLLDRDGKLLSLHAGQLSPAEAETLVRTALETSPTPPPPASTAAVTTTSGK